MAAITVSMMTTGIASFVTFNTNFLLQSPTVPAAAGIEIARNIYAQGGIVVVPSVVLASGLFFYIASKQPGRFVDSPYARAGFIHLLGIPFTGAVMSPLVIKHLAAAFNAGGGAAGVASLGGDAGVRALLLSFGRLNVVRALIFGLGAVLGLRAALLDVKRL